MLEFMRAWNHQIKWRLAVRKWAAPICRVALAGILLELLQMKDWESLYVLSHLERLTTDDCLRNCLLRVLLQYSIWSSTIILWVRRWSERIAQVANPSEPGYVAHVAEAKTNGIGADIEPLSFSQRQLSYLKMAHLGGEEYNAMLYSIGICLGWGSRHIWSSASWWQDS